jgi:hypothetical protein
MLGDRDQDHDAGFNIAERVTRKDSLFICLLRLWRLNAYGLDELRIPLSNATDRMLSLTLKMSPPPSLLELVLVLCPYLP